MNNFAYLLLLLFLSACSSPSMQPSQQPTATWRGQPNAQGVDESTDGPGKVALSRQKPRVEYLASTSVAKRPVSKQTEPLRTNDEEKAADVEKIAEGQKYELNFQEAEIKGVVDAVMGDILKLNYVVKPEIQGRTTLRTGKPVDRDALFSALEAALHSLSIAIIFENGVYQVVPKEMAPRFAKGTRMVTPSSVVRPGYAIEIFPLTYIDAVEMRRILESFVPKETMLQVNEQYRLLVVTGTSQERASVRQAVESFDKDWLEGKNLALYHLEQLDAEQLVADLKQVFQPPMNFLGGRVRLIPIPRIKTILGVAESRSDLEEAEDWIRRLDKTKATGKRLFVYSVQHGVAKDLVIALRQVLEGIAAGKNTETNQGIEIPLAASTHAPAVTADPSSLVAVEESNSIIFYGEEEKFSAIKDALKIIDVFPRQVMIEAILAEVVLNDSLRYGVQWFYDSGENKVTLSSIETGAVASQFPGFSYVYSGLANARLVLNALAEKTDVRVLSAPKLSVLNNQKASLQVGDQVPVVTQISQSTSTPGAPIVNSIQMRDTGVILEVTPRISDNGNVTLFITQEVSDVTQTKSSGIDSPTIQRRRIQTVVSTRDGNTVALGGLIRENGSKGNSGIPFLKDIPIIGNAFRTNTSDTRRSELIILLVPHVMRNQDETQAVVDALAEGMDSATKAAERARPITPKRKN
jgi:general secretion pathway protein D